MARSSSSSVPLSSSSSSFSSGVDAVPVEEEPNGDAGGGGPGLQDVAAHDGEPRSSTLRRMGITNGVLGVSQERVEKVMKKALPVMGGMASQNVLNLADSVMVGRSGGRAGPLPFTHRCRRAPSTRHRLIHRHQ